MTRDEPKRRDGHRLSTVRDSALRSKGNPASNSRRAATTASYREAVPGRALSQTRSQEHESTPPDPVAQAPVYRPIFSPNIVVSGDATRAADTDGRNGSDESLDWDEESVESLDWEEESVVSVASSATTIDGDTVGMLFNRLLNFGDLRFLWPQLIAQSRSWKRSQRTVERLLLRYCQDLDKLRANPISNQSITESQRIMRKKASKFIRRALTNLAQRICEAHYRGNAEDSRSAEDEAATWVEKNPDAANDSDSEDDEPMLFLEEAEIFLFGTDPILYMQANLKALVKMRIPQNETSFVTRVCNYTRLHFENIANSFERNAEPIMPGSTRLHWTCACGKALHDDFVELRPGALADLDELLQSYGKDARFNNGISTQEIIQTLDDENLTAQTHPRQQTGWKQSVSSAANSCIGLLTSLVPSSASLPHYRQDMDSDIATTGACIQTGSGGAGMHDFLLLCIPFMRVATKLYQPEICRINSDQEFLKLLRHYYQTKRGRSPWRLLRKVKSINFIKVRHTPKYCNLIATRELRQHQLIEAFMPVRNVPQRSRRHTTLSKHSPTREKRHRVRIRSGRPIPTRPRRDAAHRTKSPRSPF